MERTVEEELGRWKGDKHRLPLILRGARQVGKTYTIEKFGRDHFDTFLSVNFELNPEFKSCFDQLDPQQITNNLELITNRKIVPGETLLFLDEIQECTQAIRSLRYFKEKLPELHVIGAGSLLEFTLNDERYSFPVGRVQFMHMNPLSFHEFLMASDQNIATEALKTMTLDNPPSDAVHNHLLKLVREYFFVGGMPAVVNLYREGRSFLKCSHLLAALFRAFTNDFGKYASKTEHKYLQKLYEKAPFIVARHFQFKKIDPEMRSRDLRTALDHLRHAGLIYQIFATSGNGLPLEATINEKKFKLLFLDIGLLQSALKLDSSVFWEKDLHQINEGVLAEQFVGQELLAYQDYFLEKKLYFWERPKKTSAAEVDYVTSYNSTVIPIEVKAGSTGRLKSLHRFLEEKKSTVGVRISKHPLSFDGKILSVPFYLIGELSRLLVGK